MLFFLEFNFAGQIKVAESNFPSPIDHKADHNFPNELFSTKGAIKERWGFKLRRSDNPDDVVFIDGTVAQSFSKKIFVGEECVSTHPLTARNFSQEIKDAILVFDGTRPRLGSTINTAIKTILIGQYGLKVGKTYIPEGGIKKEDWLKAKAKSEAEALKN